MTFVEIDGHDPDNLMIPAEWAFEEFGSVGAVNQRCRPK